MRPNDPLPNTDVPEHRRLPKELHSDKSKKTTFFNIKIDLREIGWDGIDWVDLAEDRDQWRALVNTVLNLRVA
jgi:hypothetical protein